MREAEVGKLEIQIFVKFLNWWFPGNKRQYGVIQCAGRRGRERQEINT